MSVYPESLVCPVSLSARFRKADVWRATTSLRKGSWPAVCQVGLVDHVFAEVNESPDNLGMPTLEPVWDHGIPRGGGRHGHDGRCDTPSGHEPYAVVTFPVLDDLLPPPEDPEFLVLVLHPLCRHDVDCR